MGRDDDKIRLLSVSLKILNSEKLRMGINLDSSLEKRAIVFLVLTAEL